MMLKGLKKGIVLNMDNCIDCIHEKNCKDKESRSLVTSMVGNTMSIFGKDTFRVYIFCKKFASKDSVIVDIDEDGIK